MCQQLCSHAQASATRKQYLFPASFLAWRVLQPVMKELCQSYMEQQQESATPMSSSWSANGARNSCSSFLRQSLFGKIAHAHCFCTMGTSATRPSLPSKGHWVLDIPVCCQVLGATAMHGLALPLSLWSYLGVLSLVQALRASTARTIVAS